MRLRSLLVVFPGFLLACYLLLQAIVMPRVNAFWAAASATATAASRPSPTVWINIHYSADKGRWMNEAARLYMERHPGLWIEQVEEGSPASLQRLTELATRGESAFASAPLLWSPASTMQVDVFKGVSVQMLRRDAAVNCRPLVITPMVLMMWADRAAVLEAYLRDRGGLTLDNVQHILATTDGTWQAVGGDPAWGAIKFGMLDPQQSNAGMLALLTIASHYYSEPGPLTTDEVRSDAVREYLAAFVRATRPQPIIGSIRQLGDLLAQDVPPLYDILLITEVFVAELQQHMQILQRPTRLIYLQPTYVANNPLCLIDRPTLTAPFRDAALGFQTFLLQPEIQAMAGRFGQRPVLRSVSAFLPDSLLSTPFMQQAGAREDYGTVLPLPDPATLSAALDMWQQVYAAR
jgi:hypothetical protein